VVHNFLLVLSHKLKSPAVQHTIENDKHEVELPTRQKETQSNTGETPRSRHEQFVDAAKDGKLDEVKSFFCRVPQCMRNMVGGLRLDTQHKRGHEAVVKLLVENGADLNARMDVGWEIFPGDGSALTWAAGGGYLEVVRYLAARGANLDIQA
jgi:ankyrin repeat protein